MIAREAMTMYELTGNGFTTMTQEKIKGYISMAKNKIVYAKPAFYEKEMQVLIEAANRGVQCDVYFDKGDLAVRRGFGDKKAIEMILGIGDYKENTLPPSFRYHLKDRIRLAFLIADDVVIIFAPNIKAFEDETDDVKFPNGIICKGELSDNVVRLFVPETENVSEPTKTMILTIGQDEGESEEESTEENEDSKEEENENESKNKPEAITVTVTVNQPEDPEEMEQELLEAFVDLDLNPPPKPENLQKTLFYTIEYKLMKVVTKGTELRKKQISLSPFYKLIGVTPSNTIVEWKVTDASVTDILEGNEDLARTIKGINKEYMKEEKLFYANEYGFIIKATAVKEYKEKLEKAKEEFLDRFYKNKNHEADKLQQILDESANKLEDLLYKHCSENFDAFKKALKRDTQFARLADNPNKMTVFQNFMEQTDYIHTVLRFPTREAMLDKISIKFVFNDISDENLNDSDFVAILEKHKIEPRKYSTGYKEKYNDGLSSDN